MPIYLLVLAFRFAPERFTEGMDNVTIKREVKTFLNAQHQHQGSVCLITQLQISRVLTCVGFIST